MALQLGALRDALIEAGATEALAKAASEEVATYERQQWRPLFGWLWLFLSLAAWVLTAAALWLLVLIAAKVGAI